MTSYWNDGFIDQNAVMKENTLLDGKMALNYEGVSSRDGKVSLSRKLLKLFVSWCRKSVLLSSLFHPHWIFFSIFTIDGLLETVMALACVDHDHHGCTLYSGFFPPQNVCKRTVIMHGELTADNNALVNWNKTYSQQHPIEQRSGSYMGS